MLLRGLGKKKEDQSKRSNVAERPQERRPGSGRKGLPTPTHGPTLKTHGECLRRPNVRGYRRTVDKNCICAPGGAYPVLRGSGTPQMQKGLLSTSNGDVQLICAPEGASPVLRECGTPQKQEGLVSTKATDM